uniref:Uncharacterized protein n=1 Tax=Panagrolaimus davidi TaxID=227884 RepID=A0A914QJL6_9BILA
MQTKDGERHSTPEFLLAFFLKNGIHRIKEETGKKMKEIEIAFDGFIPNETLKKNFVEAGLLLKIDIVFA